MTIASVFQQFVQQLQFLGMLSNLDIQWPAEWLSFTSYLNVLNFDLDNVIGQNKIPVLTFRVIFIIVSICVPIVINVLLLIIFQPVYVVLWYLGVSFGSVLFIAGIFGMFLPSTGVQSNSNEAQTYVIAGAAVLFILIVLLVVMKLVDRYTNKGLDRTALAEQTADYWLRFHRARSLRHTAVFVAFLLVGLVLLGIVDFSPPGTTGTKALFNTPIYFIFGIVLASIAGLLLIYMLLTLCAGGRKALAVLTRVVSNNLLLLLLALITMSFIPTVSYSMDIFLCTDYVCPKGYSFNPYVVRPTNNFDVSSARFCDKCVIKTTAAYTCGAADAAFTYCPGYTDYRSWKNPDTTCSDEATVYFYLAALIVLVNYMLGIPALYFTTIRYLTSKVLENSWVAPQGDDETEDEWWQRKMMGIDPVPASLYDPFRYGKRYFLLVMLMHRLLITVTLSIATAYSAAAAALVLLFHGVACVITVVFKPFINESEQVLGIALAVCNMLNGAYAVYVWQRNGGASSESAYIFLLLNGVIPAIAVVIIRAKIRMSGRAKAAEEEEAKHEPIEGAENAEGATDAAQDEEMQELAANAAPVVVVAGAAFVRVDDEGNEVVELTEEEERELHNLRKTSAYNTYATTHMNKAFMFMGVFFLFALGIAFLGTLRTSPQEFVVGTDAAYQTPAYAIGGYTNWTDFTQHCCCIEATTQAQDFNTTERWICHNGNTVERGRVTLNLADNGILLRGVCETSFRPGCQLIMQGTGTAPKFFCSDHSSFVDKAGGVTNKAYKLYW
jgi:hypothetical protein